MVLWLQSKQCMHFFTHTLSQKSSILSKYFLEDKEAQIKMSRWIRKESKHQFYIRRPYVPCEYIFNLLQGVRIQVPNKNLDSFHAELELFGIPIPKKECIQGCSDVIFSVQPQGPRNLKKTGWAKLSNLHLP